METSRKEILKCQPFGQPVGRLSNPNRLTESAFLVGPEQADEVDDVLDIDDIFAKPHDRVIRELLDYSPNQFDLDASQPITRSRYSRDADSIDDQIFFVPVEAGLLVTNGHGKVFGGYLSCDVSISPEIQGRGIGAELILEYYMRNGYLPTWDLDKAAYSQAGHQAHISAHQLGLNKAFYQAKAADLKKPYYSEIAPDLGPFAAARTPVAKEMAP
jgi:GNAT superfamily N-acetyltransferase